MKLFKLGLVSDPSFNSVINLSNTLFDPNNVRSGHMATEDQVKQLYDRIIAADLRREECCHDIVFWEARTQIVRLNSNTINTNGFLNSGGVVVSNFDENISAGIARRGLKFTVTFPVKWDDNLFFPVTPENVKSSTSSIGCSSSALSSADDINKFQNLVQYRYLKDSNIVVNNCTASNSTRSGFMLGSVFISGSTNVTTKRGTYNANDDGLLARFGDNWGPFIYNMSEDGTVTIVDSRTDTDFDVIRFYTQWTLNQCGDGTLLSDVTYVGTQPRK